MRVKSMVLKAMIVTTLLALGLLSLLFAPLLHTATAHSPSLDWPSFQYNSDHTGTNTAERVLKPPLTQVWSKAPDTSAVSALLEIRNTLYVKYGDGLLFALNDRSGAVKWQVHTHYPWSLAYANGVIYTPAFCSSCQTWTVNGYTARTGAQVLQSAALPGDITGITVANNVIYAGTADTLTPGVPYHTLTAFSAISGHVMWQDSTDDAVISYPVVQNGIVYFGTYQGSMYAVQASTGQILWQHGGIYAKSSPILQNGILYEGSGNEGPGGPFFALNASTGQTLWDSYGLTFGYYTSPAYANGVLYAQSSGNLGAFNATTGQLLWEDPIGFEGGEVITANGVVYVEANSAHSPIAMYAIDPATGAILWRFLGTSPFRSPLIANHTLYFGSDDGVLYAFHTGK